MFSPQLGANPHHVSEQPLNSPSASGETPAVSPTSGGSPSTRRVSLCSEAYGPFGRTPPQIDSRAKNYLAERAEGTRSNNDFQENADTLRVGRHRHAHSDSSIVGSPPPGAFLGRIRTLGGLPGQAQTFLTEDPLTNELRTPGGSLITDEEVKLAAKDAEKKVNAYTPSQENVDTQTTAQTLLEKAKSVDKNSQRIALEVLNINIDNYLDKGSQTKPDTEKVAKLARTISEKITGNRDKPFSTNHQRLVLVTSYEKNPEQLTNLALLADKNQKFQVALKETLENFGVILGGIKVTDNELESKEIFQTLNDSVANQHNPFEHKPLVHVIAPNLMFEPQLPFAKIHEKLLRIFEPGYAAKESRKFDLQEILSIPPEVIESNQNDPFFKIRKVFTQRAKGFCEDLWVLKFGSLQLDPDNLQNLIDACARLREKGIKVVVVASGAVMYGTKIQKQNKAQLANLSRPSLAAIGQPWLDQLLTTCSASRNMSAVQLLLSPWQLADESQRQRVADTILSLLHEGKLPVINGNDVTGLPGGNDEVASLINYLIRGRLALTTNKPGMYNKFGTPEQQLIQTISVEEAKKLGCASGATSSAGTGGFATKLTAAAVNKGYATYIVEGGATLGEITRMEAVILAVTEHSKELKSNSEVNPEELPSSKKLRKIPYTAIYSDVEVPLTYSSEKV